MSVWCITKTLYLDIVTDHSRLKMYFYNVIYILQNDEPSNLKIDQFDIIV